MTAIILPLLAWPLACGGGEELRRDLAQIKERQREMYNRASQIDQRITEIQNRVFILDDKVDTNLVALMRCRGVPELKVVKIEPQEEGGAKGSGAQGRAVQGGGATGVAGAGGPEDGKGPPVVETPLSRYLPPKPKTHRARGVTSSPRRKSRTLSTARSQSYRKAGSPRQLYQRSLNSYRAEDYQKAIEGFRTFLRLFPRHEYSDNALYWLGECYYSLKDYPRALEEFRQVPRRFPAGNKVPDAMLKMGYTYLLMKEEAKARQFFRQVVEQYPASEPAALAREKLGLEP